VVTAVEAEPGAVLAAGTPVLRLAHDGPRDAVFAVPEDARGACAPCWAAQGAVQVKLWGAPSVLPATVREVAAAADPTTRTFLGQGRRAWPSLAAGPDCHRVIDLPRREGVTRLPLSAVMQQQGQTAVWLLDRSSMTVKTQRGRGGRADGNTVVVVGPEPRSDRGDGRCAHADTGAEGQAYQGPDNPPGTASSAPSRLNRAWR
jgi:multidrug efflux system membrane fusion protein